MKKTILLIGLTIAMLGALCTCAADTETIPKDALTVNCPVADVTYLLPGEYPEEYAEDAEAFRWGYNVFVSKLNADDRLVLSANRNEGLASTPNTHCGTYYQSGDWVGGSDGVYFGAKKLIDERCVGMVASQAAGAILIITNTDDNSYVYGAVLVDGEWRFNTEERIELGSQTKFIYYGWGETMRESPPETMLVITENSLVSLSVGGYLGDKRGGLATVTKTAMTKMPEYWDSLRPTSAVELNGKLYLGDMFGVVEWDMRTQTFIYYPIHVRGER